jgi:hypothetical protein
MRQIVREVGVRARLPFLDTGAVYPDEPPLYCVDVNRIPVRACKGVNRSEAAESYRDIPRDSVCDNNRISGQGHKSAA